MKKVASLLVLMAIATSLHAQDFFKLVQTGTPDQVRAAVEAGANVSGQDGTGWTPLMYAAQFNTEPRVISVLLKAGASVSERDMTGYTPLMWAAQSNSNPC